MLAITRGGTLLLSIVILCRALSTRLRGKRGMSHLWSFFAEPMLELKCRFGADGLSGEALETPFPETGLLNKFGRVPAEVLLEGGTRNAQVEEFTFFVAKKGRVGGVKP